MAKKDNTPKLNPSICLRSLTAYQERVSAMMNLLPMTLEMIEKSSDPALKKAGEMLADHYNALQEFHDNIPNY
jgi:hypothetical protein